jgi:DNA invertase Pin-like site-specific DNA recombinase
MRRAAVSGEVDVVIVHSVDRLPRNEPEFWAVLMELDGHGVPVHFVKNRHGIRARALRRLRQAANALIWFVPSLFGRGNSNTARNRE